MGGVFHPGGVGALIDGDGGGHLEGVGAGAGVEAAAFGFEAGAEVFEAEGGRFCGGAGEGDRARERGRFGVAAFDRGLVQFARFGAGLDFDGDAEFEGLVGGEAAFEGAARRGGEAAAEGLLFVDHTFFFGLGPGDGERLQPGRQGVGERDRVGFGVEGGVAEVLGDEGDLAVGAAVGELAQRRSVGGAGGAAAEFFAEHADGDGAIGEGAGEGDRVGGGGAGAAGDLDVAGADFGEGFEGGADGRGGGVEGDRGGALGALRLGQFDVEGEGAGGGADGEFLDLVGGGAGLDVGGAGAELSCHQGDAAWTARGGRNAPAPTATTMAAADTAHAASSVGRVAPGFAHGKSFPPPRLEPARLWCAFFLCFRCFLACFFLDRLFVDVAGAVEGEGAGGGVGGRDGGELAAVAFAFDRPGRLRFAAADAGVVDVEGGVGVAAGELGRR